VNVKRITNLTVVVIFACLMIAFCAGSLTTFAADEHATDLCAQCGEPNDGHVDAHHDGSHHEDAGHHEHDEHNGHDEHKGHNH
jgi:ABC-type Zn2+ transport system substrate-binding protein/surface adhesin